jgi:hypothetical protein
MNECLVFMAPFVLSDWVIEANATIRPWLMKGWNLVHMWIRTIDPSDVSIWFEKEQVYMYLTKTVVYSAYSSIETNAPPHPTALSKLFKFEKIMHQN